MSTLKKLVYVLIFLLVVIYSSQCFAATGTVTASTLRIRKEASTSAETLTEVSKDEKVEILESLDGWYKVKYKDYTGYMSSQYLKADEQVEEEQKEEEPQEEEQTQEQSDEQTTTVEPQELNENMYITLNTNMHIIPSISSSIISVINTDKQVEVQKTINNWSYVTNDDISGWVRNAKLTNDVVTLPEEQQEETQEETETEPTEEIEEQVEEIVSSKGYINVSSANLREEPSTTSASIGGLVLNEQVEIIEKLDGWYKIKADGKTGYVASKLVSANQSDTSRGTAVVRPAIEQEAEVKSQIESMNKTMYVSVSSARVRSEPNTTSSIVTNVTKTKEVKVTGKQNDWYQVQVNGKTGYIRQDLVTADLSSIKVTTTNTASSNNVVANLPSTGDKGTDIVNFAKQFLGYSYVYGGTTPSSGFDCSGFVYYVYNQCGISMSRSLSAQAAAGAHVDKSQLQPGDLLIFSDGTANKNVLGHSGIYIGNNQMIHAANPRRGVVTDTIASGYYLDNYISARRVIL